MTLTIKYTAHQMITRYLELRQQKQDLTDLHKSELAPITKAMEVIEGAMAIFLRETGQDSARAEHGDGTAFKMPWFSAKVSDPVAFQNFVFENNARHFLTNHVLKEAVKTYMDTHQGMPPPGISTDRGTNIQFRKGKGE
jgi:hypothetical protein